MSQQARAAIDLTVPQRRAQVRAAERAGLDAVDVQSNGGQPVLRLVFIGRTPRDLDERNILIRTPDGTPPMRAVGVERRAGDDQAPEHVTIRLDRHGGPGIFHLRLVGVRRDGSVSRRPPRSVDARFAEVAFSFDEQRPVPGAGPSTPVPHPARAVEQQPVNYLARDYAGLRRLLLDRLAVTQPDRREEHVADLGVMLVELFAYLGDDLAYGQDDVATEAYLSSARSRMSVRRHARLVGYDLHEGCNARAWMCADVAADVSVRLADVSFVARGPGEQALLGDQASELCFTPVALTSRDLPEDARVTWRQAHSDIAIWNFGESDSWLTAGSTSLALVDGTALPVDERTSGPPQRDLELEVGDVVVIEAVHDESGLGPADPSARHPVRITALDRGFDELYAQPYLRLGWALEDALPFDLKVSTTSNGRPVACAHLRGNVLLVAHGTCVDTDLEVGAPLRLDPGLAYSQPFPRGFVVARHQARELRRLDDRLRARVEGWQRLADLGWPLGEDVRTRLLDLFGDAVDGLPEATSTEDAWYQADVLAELLTNLDRVLSDRRDRAEELARRCEADGILDGALLAELTRDWGPELAARLDAASPSAAGPAASALANEPRLARPLVRISTIPAPGQPTRTWYPRHDLLRSGPDADGFVVETGLDGSPRLRFPATSGPPSSGKLHVTYWVGGGPRGNVAAEAIRDIRLEGGSGKDRITRVYNPLPAVGGVAPEVLEDAKRSIPGSFTADQPRALVPADYADWAARLDGVLSAASELRFTGTGRLIDVCVQPQGTPEPPDWFLREVAHRLERVRRIGDEVRVLAPRYRPLFIRLSATAVPGADPVLVGAGIRRQLGSDWVTATVPGLFHPGQLHFGQTIWPSAVIAAAMEVADVEEVTLLDWGALPEHARTGVTVEGGTRTMEPIRCSGLEMPRLDDDPVHPSHGYLDVDVRVLR